MRQAVVLDKAEGRRPVAGRSVTVRLTEQEYTALQAACSEAGLSISEGIRQLVSRLRSAS